LSGKQKQNDMNIVADTTTDLRIKEINSIMKSWNYDNNGNPIGVNASEYVSLCEELETLENL